MVLFDEIEKAHEDVWNVLLQALEDGQLTDAQGRRADLRNCVLILTSNVGARQITGGPRLGFSSSTAEDGLRPLSEIQAAVMEQAKRIFRPEFLNRLDETIVFRQLGQEQLSAIARRMLEELSRRLSALGVELEVTAEGEAALIRAGFDPDYGARPLRRAIRTQVEDPAAELLLSGELTAGGRLAVTAKDGQVILLPSPAALSAG